MALAGVVVGDVLVPIDHSSGCEGRVEEVGRERAIEIVDDFLLAAEHGKVCSADGGVGHLFEVDLVADVSEELVVVALRAGDEGCGGVREAVEADRSEVELSRPWTHNAHHILVACCVSLVVAAGYSHNGRVVD